MKHAHVVLRKVGEEEFEDPKGRKRTRGIYSFFAQKVINVKPGMKSSRVHCRLTQLMS